METYRDLGEKILSTLIDLYADQMGVKIDYTIIDVSDKEEAPKSDSTDMQEVRRCG